MKMKHELEDEWIAGQIHYPEDWDTAAYPTLAEALWELYSWERAKNLVQKDACQTEKAGKTEKAGEKKHSTRQTTTGRISFLTLWGLLAPLGVMLLMVVIWFMAYLSPGRSVVIGVDWYGEAKYEMILIPIATVLAVLGQWKILRSM